MIIKKTLNAAKSWATKPAVKPNNTTSKKSQTGRVEDKVELSSASQELQSKIPKFKLGTLVHGAIGAITSMIPVIGVGAIAAGSAALPWAEDTAYNNSQHSSDKSILGGAAGLVGGALLNLGGLTAAVAAGSLLPMVPAAVAGGYLFGKMAQIDSSIGTWDAF